MAASLTRSRALSLHVPITSESERAHFQRRLAFTLMAIFALALAFFVLQLAMLAASAPWRIAELFSHRSLQIQLVTTFVALIAALWLRRGKRSARLLDMADGAATIAICIGWAVLIAPEPQPFARGELIALLATSYTLALRAALIPSTPARSAFLGLLAMMPIFPLAIHLYGTEPPRDPLGINHTSYVAIWALVGIACTTTISYVIYGLRMQVRKASQLGQYQLEEKIGEGGMGVVYRAHHALLRRPTAIKLLTARTGHAIERFEREVQLTAKLTHPNTVAIYDYGRTPERVFYYAMEYLQGIALDQLVQRFGPQPVSRVVHILVQICGALGEAHAVGLVHRDIKPSNVMLTERGGEQDVVKVLDFGLAREIQSPNLELSGTNTLIGTPHYLSPEAIIDPDRVDGRADLYALGATAYYLLTGTCVFDAASVVEVCSLHLHQPPTGPRSKRPDVPKTLDRIVLACLAKRREDRPASARAVADMLRTCGIPEWTADDARAWWARVPAAERVTDDRGRPVMSDASDPSTSGTLPVALDRGVVT